jgi:hypothetical protein
MRSSHALMRSALIVATVTLASQAMELKKDTLAAWTDYVRGADARMERVANGRPFLWVDESAARLARVQRGQVLVEPMVGRGTRDVSNGLIHDWMGAAFIPNTSAQTLLAVLHDYDRYQDIYKPAVTESKQLTCGEAEQEFSMKWARHVLFVTAAIQGRYRAHDVMLDAHHGYQIADSISVREIEGYGQATERLLPEDRGQGFLWRVHTMLRYAERDGGVYVELEAIALTRDIPASLHWLVKPAVNHLSVNSLTTTLEETREAVARAPQLSAGIGSCSGKLWDAVALKRGGME